MRYFFTILTLFYIYNGFSQDAGRGALAKKIEKKHNAEKRALIIGISKYSEEKLELNYADNDAILFKDYLSKVEQIPDENISILINEDAVSINIFRAFKNLLKTTQADDIIYIYFAGHGDVVDDFGEKEGFLLAADVNANQEYYAGGVIPLGLLNNKIINSLTQKGAKVILILDACKSGFLFEQGSQKNLGTIQAMFENSTKFLSCGPTELSYESGDLKHGYFTYYLVKGLIGNADSNADKNIQFREIDDYLYDNVYTEVSKKFKQSQTPIVRAPNARATLKTIDTKSSMISFENIKSAISNSAQLVARNSIPVSEDKAVNSLIKKFNTAIENSNYYGKSTSALELYKSVLKNIDLPEGFSDKMKYKLIEKLYVSAQKLINKYIDGSHDLPYGREFTKQAKYLEICINLMDEDDFLKPKLEAGKLLLESYAIIRNKNYSEYRIAKRKLKAALKIEPRGAYIHNALGLIYNSQEVYDSAHYHFNQAKSLISSWRNPVLNLSENLMDQYKYDDAKNYLDTSLGTNGTNAETYIKLGAINENLGKYRLAELNYNKALEIHPDNIIAIQKISNLQHLKGNQVAAIAWNKKAFQKDSSRAISNYGLFKYIKDYAIDDAVAEKLLLNAIDKNPDYAQNYIEYADFLRITKTKRNRLLLADSLYNIAININPKNPRAYAGRGFLQFDLRQRQKSKLYFDEGIVNNPNNPESYFYYANFFDKVKNIKQAEIYYLKALATDKNYLPAYSKLTELYNNSKQHIKSITLLQKQISQNGEAPEYWNLLGETFFSKSEYSKAIDAFQKALEIDPTYVKGLSDLGFSELQTNNFESAKEHYLLATTYNPYKNKKSKIAEYLLSQAKTKEKFGTPADAKALYKLASEIDNSVTVGLEYTNFLYLNGEAQKCLDKVLELLKNCNTKDSKIQTLELIIKAAVDTNNTEISKTYFKQLSTNFETDHLISAIYYSYNNDIKQYNFHISKVNPLLLRSTKLKSSYSANTIKNHILK